MLLQKLRITKLYTVAKSNVTYW